MIGWELGQLVFPRDRASLALIGLMFWSVLSPTKSTFSHLCSFPPPKTDGATELSHVAVPAENLKMPLISLVLRTCLHPSGTKDRAEAGSSQQYGQVARLLRLL